MKRKKPLVRFGYMQCILVDQVTIEILT